MTASTTPYTEPAPDSLLERKALAAALTARGFRISATTLAIRASVPERGGSPPFRRFGRRVLYRWQDALDWAEGSMSEVLTSSRRTSTTN
ncbi:MAG: DNA-binding protein [Bradyrhizobium sp.]|uniref:hypothetical protein n=1 Tax=Bradyrhizobium sp. TaxID=376 RepID=UPI003D1350F8